MSNALSFTRDTLSATAETALTELNRAPDGVALVDAWVDAKNADAVQEIAERGSGKPRSAARRGLNILKSRGVPIPPRRKLPASQSVSGPVIEATLIPPDGSGTSVYVLSKAHPSGRCTACFVYLNDGLGVHRVERVDSTLNKVKNALNRGGGHQPKPVTVPLEWARHRIAEARKLHRQSKVPEPLGFDSSRDLLEPLPDQAPEHPFDTEGFEFADDDAKDLASDSGALHHLPEFASWLPSNEAMNELFREVGTLIAGDTTEGAEPDQARMGEHLKTAMLNATDRYFDEAQRSRTIGWMKDAALGVLLHKGEAEALKVAATIQVIGRCGLITDPPRDVPFLRAFFEKGVSLAMMTQGGQLQIPMPRGSQAESAAGAAS